MLTDSSTKNTREDDGRKRFATMNSPCNPGEDASSGQRREHFFFVRFAAFVVMFFFPGFRSSNAWRCATLRFKYQR
jgi:hypothetical protein